MLFRSRLRRHAQASPEIFDASILQLLDALLTAAAEAEQTLALQRARIRYLESLSVTDEMTGLLNRRGFGLELSRALARARRQNESGLLVMCDLDNFKAINDRSEEHTSELQSLMRISYAVFFLKQKKNSSHT